MNKIISIFFLFVAAAVSAFPIIFNKALIDGHDARFAIVHHGAHFPAGGKLRFLHLVPKLGAEIRHFATEGKGIDPKILDFLKFDADEVFDHFIGISDCLTWHAGIFATWTPLGIKHHAFIGEKGDAGFTGKLIDIPAAIDFIAARLSIDAYKKLILARLPAHWFTFMLHKRYDLAF